MMVDGEVIDVDDLPELFRGQDAGTSPQDEGGLSLEAVQNRHLLRVLQSVDGNKVRAAEILGIGRATLYKMLARMTNDRGQTTSRITAATVAAPGRGI